MATKFYNDSLKNDVKDKNIIDKINSAEVPLPEEIQYDKNGKNTYLAWYNCGYRLGLANRRVSFFWIQIDDNKTIDIMYKGFNDGQNAGVNYIISNPEWLTEIQQPKADEKLQPVPNDKK